MTLEDNNELVRIFYERLWNRWDMAAVPEILSPDIVFRGSLGMEKKGRSGFVEYVEFVRAAFPDFHNAIEETITEGDSVAARLTYRGTRRGELFGVPPTNRKVEYAGVALFTFSDGKISRVWVLGDMLSVMRQIGEG